MLSIAVGSDLTQLACHVVNTVGEHGFLVQLFPALFFLWLLGLGFLLRGFSWFDTVVLNGLEDTKRKLRSRSTGFEYKRLKLELRLVYLFRKSFMIAIIYTN
jgi:hypothetical protein